MKSLNAVIERNEDVFYAYIKEIDGCVAGGESYNEVKSNLEQNAEIFIQEDNDLKLKYGKGYVLNFKVSLDSVFDLIPEINITQLAKLGEINPGLLRQYVSGTKKASEKQAEKVMIAIDKLISKLNSISLST
jgi:predicted RNase H-like HicB family nuclease